MKPWQNWSAHRQRWFTALVLAVPVIAVLGWGPLGSWVALVALVALVGLWEFQLLVGNEGLPISWQAFFFLIGALFPAAAYAAGPRGLHVLLVAGLLSLMAWIMFLEPLEKRWIERLSRALFGWVYIPYMLSYAILLGRTQSPRAWLFMVLLVLVAGDVGAYYTGRAIGRHKLNRRVSPNKTVEGSLGGLAASVVVGVLFGILFLPGVAVGRVALLAFMLEGVGQLGDLVESMIKRMHGKKDSSNLLPGHGGLLDRLDSLLFAFPTAWFIISS